MGLTRRPGDLHSGAEWDVILELLSRGSRRLKLSLSPAQLFQLVAQLQELRRWGATSRLTGYQSDRDRAVFLTLDSMIMALMVPDAAEGLIDIGSGAGFPGLVLKIVRPRLQVALVESTRRRSNFLRHMIRQLQLAGVEVLCGRAEEFQRALAGRFDVATLRAVASPAKAIEIAKPFVGPGGAILVSLGPGVTTPKVPKGWSCETFTVRLPFSRIQRRVLKVWQAEYKSLLMC